MLVINLVISYICQLCKIFLTTLITRTTNIHLIPIEIRTTNSFVCCHHRRMQRPKVTLTVKVSD